MNRDTSSRPNLYGMGQAELVEITGDLGQPAYRGRQMMQAIYRRDELDPRQWSQFPLALREEVRRRFVCARPEIAQFFQAPDGTRKAVIKLPPGDEVEAVALPTDARQTFCVSSQVGCAYGCTFCMTARLGFRRHLTPGEIVGQVAALTAMTGADERRLNVVFMGMGEPLHNAVNVFRALELLTDPLGFGLGPRRITVSTVGLPDRIEQLSRLPRPPRLAVSLVSAIQDRREELMPVARGVDLNRLAAAIRTFGDGRRDRPTLEAVLLRDVNDRVEDAEAMAAFAGKSRAKVNLIPFNPTPELPFLPATEKRIEAFLAVLARRGVVGTVRRSQGREIEGACGQLAFTRRRKDSEPPTLAGREEPH